MGMTIDDNVDFLNEAKKLFEDIANNPNINETIKTYFIIESLEIAISTMRKYQKIQEIVENRNSKPPLVTLNRIIHEVEDGKID